MVTPARSTLRPLDPAAVAQVRRRLHQAPGAPWLHAEVARRMAERLSWILRQPETVLDWEAFLGASGGLLSAAYPRATRWAVESDAALVERSRAAQARRWWPLRGMPKGTERQLPRQQVAPGQGQLLWANMALTGVLDPQAEMRHWHRALEVDGFLMFSTLGPGSLQRLNTLYAAQHWPPPFAPFVDMHDLGDMLVEAGFADPVMDQETLTLRWATGARALSELRQLGGNVDPRRMPGLRTPRWQRRLEALLETAPGTAAGPVALDFEIVYGHAFKVSARPRLAAETTVPLEELRAMARAGRPRR